MAGELKRIKCNLAGLASAFVAVAFLPTYAEGAELYKFAIEEQSLGGAINALSRQSGVVIIVPSGVVEGRTAPAISGEMTVMEALSRLLAGSDLDAALDSSGAIIVRRRVAAIERDRGSPSPDELSRVQDVVIVTGTNIRGNNNKTVSAISIGRDELIDTGQGTLQDALAALPQNLAGGGEYAASEFGGVTGRGANASNNVSGLSSINLRGAGARGTLILLNGRRLAPGGGGRIVDISAIPVAAIDRVEVLADGASAIYGADAVGGVVNIIMRDDFEGAETRLRYGAAPGREWDEFLASQAFGAVWNTGNIVVSGEFSDRSNFPISARPELLSPSALNDYQSLGEDIEGSYSPSNKRASGSVHLTQHLWSGAEFSFNGLYSDTGRFVRDGFVNAARVGLIRQELDETQTNLSAGFRQELPKRWMVDLAASYSRYFQLRQQETFLAGAPYSSQNDKETQQTFSTDLIFSGDVLSLNGEAISAAFGVSYVDAAARTVTSFDSPAERNVLEYDRDNFSVFGEAYIPLISPSLGIPFVTSLSASVAVRRDNYSDFGSTTNPKFGLAWEPYEDLLLRATYGTSFNTPAPLASRSGAENTLTAQVYYYFSAEGVQDVPVMSLFGAVPLGPESAKVFNAGFDYTLGDTGFRLGATYYNIRYDDIATRVPYSSNALNMPELAGVITTPVSVGEIQALVDRAGFFMNNTSASLDEINHIFDMRTRNISSLNISGVDFTVAYDWTIGANNFGVSLNGVRSLSFDQILTDGAPADDRNDVILGTSDFVARAVVRWSRGGTGAALFVNYVDGYKDNTSFDIIPIDSHTTVDLNLVQKLDGFGGMLRGTSIRAGVVDLFDADPPRVSEGGRARVSFDSAYVDPRGRRAFLELTKAW